jgi:hypothetical protein
MYLAVDPAASAGIVVTSFGIIGTAWGVARWASRPRFVCGIPPSARERELKGIDGAAIGRQSVTHGYRYRRKCFALRLWRRHKRELSTRDLRRAAVPLRCRTLAVSDHGVVEFPVVIANGGNRIARDYTVSIVFYHPLDVGRIHITDVVAESLLFNLDVSEPDRLRRADIRDRVTPERVRRSYDEYLSGLANFGDGIYLWGSIMEAGSTELVQVEAAVASGVDLFFLLYTVSCSDGWMRDATYLQRCNIGTLRSRSV